MANCINIRASEYKELVRKSKWGQTELKARISVWQKLNDKIGTFPTYDEIVAFFEGSTEVHTPSDYPTADEYYSRVFQQYESKHVSKEYLDKALEHLAKSSGIYGVSQLGKNILSLTHSTEVNSDFITSFIRSVIQLTSKEERIQMIKELANQGVSKSDAFKIMAEAFYHHEITSYNAKDLKNLPTIIDVFKRMSSISAFADMGTRLREYINISNFAKGTAFQAYERDYKIFQEDERIRVPYSDRGEAVKVLKDIKLKLPLQDSRIVTIEGAYWVDVQAPDRSHYESYKEDTDIAVREALLEQREAIFGDVRDTTAKEILSKLADKYPIAKQLLSIIKKDIPIHLSDSVFLNTRDTERVLGTYQYNPFRSDDNIILALGGSGVHTVIHEILHGMSIHYLRHNHNDTTADFMELYRYAKELPELKNFYGITSPLEFISEIYTNREFQEALATARPMKGFSNYKNLFREVWEIIAGWFGLNSDKTLLEQGYAITSNILVEASEWYENIDSHLEAINRELDSANREEYYSIHNVTDTFEGVNSSQESVGNNISSVLKRLNFKYTSAEITELVDTIVSEFGQVVDDHLEENPMSSREEVMNSVGISRLFAEAKENFMESLEILREDPNSTYWADNLEGMLSNYEDLVIAAVPALSVMESIRFGMDSYRVMAVDNWTESDLSQSEDESMVDEDITREESTLEGWQTNAIHTSIESSLTSKVRKVLNGLAELTGQLDEEGNPLTYVNMVGYQKNMQAGYVMNKVKDWMQDITTAKEFVERFDEFIQDNPWAQAIQDEFDYDEEFFTQFYVALQKHHTVFGVTKTKDMGGGVVEYTTINANLTEDTGPLLEGWKTTVANKTVLNPSTSIYAADGTMEEARARKNIATINEIQTKWGIAKKGTPQDRYNFISDNFESIYSLLQGVGISISSESLSVILGDAIAPIARGSYNLDSLINNIKGINIQVRNSVSKGTKYDSNIGWFQDSSGNYTGIATTIAKNTEDSREAMLNQAGKNIYTFLQPSYISKLIRNLKKMDSEWLNKEFNQYEGYLYNELSGHYNIEWLNQLTGDQATHFRNMLDHKIEWSMDSVEYSQLGDAKYQQLLFAQYFAQKDTAYYPVPILAEAPVARFVNFNKYTTNFENIIPNKFATTVFVQEFNRIQTTLARKEGIIDGTIAPILRLDGHMSNGEWVPGRGESYQFLPKLNEPEITAEINRLYEEKGFGIDLFSYVAEKIKEDLEAMVDKNMAIYKKQGLLETTTRAGKEAYKTLGFLKFAGNQTITPDNIREAIREYTYNTSFATANIIQLTTTDLAFYNGTEDFQKRFKEVHASGDAMNTQARYNGERIGKDSYKFLVLSDQFRESSPEVKGAIKELLEVQGEEGTSMPSSEVNRILDIFDDNVLSDGQAYRTLQSARTVIAMHKGWNDRLEASYNRLMDGEWSFDDYNIINQAFKPYNFNHITVDSGVMLNPYDDASTNSKLKMPTQHKYSEVILFPALVKQLKSGKLQGLLDAMNDSKNPIDVAIFESGVKVGMQHPVNINDLETPSNITKRIASVAETSIQELSYETYMIQQPVPDKLRDAQGIFGTQARAHLMSNIGSDMDFNIGGKKMSGAEVKKLYNNLISENIIESWEDLKDVFSSKERLQEMLQEEILSNTRYSTDLLHALNLEDGEFVIPLHEVSQSSRVEQLMNSIWKSRITKQKLPGGKVVNMASFGVDENLELKFSRDKDGKVHIQHMEVAMPFPSNKLPLGYEQFLDTETGVMDAEAMVKAGLIDPKLLELLSFRIPTEAAYSVWPIKIKYFYHRNGGGNIIMPAEVTTTTGLDFDIDSMYLMMRKMVLKNKYDTSKANAAFADESDVNWPAILASYKKDNPEVSNNDAKVITGYKDAYDAWFDARKENFLTHQKFEYNNPNINTDPKDMSKEQRDNLLIEVMTKIIQHPNLGKHSVNPGNFDTLRASSRRMDILNSDLDYTWEELEAMDLSQLKKIHDSISSNILNPSVQVDLYSKNMVAGQLIGIVANHSNHHSIRQGTGLKIEFKGNRKTAEKNAIPRFHLNGKFLRNLDLVENPSKTGYISTAFSAASAASVDAVKDPVLGGMNYNTATADVAMMLTALGYTENEIGLFLRQPIVMEWAHIVLREGKNDKEGAFKILNKQKLSYSDLIRTNPALFSKLNAENTGELLNAELANNIKIGAKMDRLAVEGNLKDAPMTIQQSMEFMISQQRVLENLEAMVEVAQELAEFIAASRAHTGNGGAGPTMIDNLLNQDKLDKHITNSFKSRGTLQNANSLASTPEWLFSNPEKMREWLRNAPLGYVQAFTTFGWNAANAQFKSFFPHFSNDFKYMRNIVAESTGRTSLSKFLTKKLYDAYTAYNMSQFDSYNSQEADRMINEFPGEVSKIINENPELKDLDLFKSLEVRLPTTIVPVSTIKFRAGGRLHSLQRDQIMREWEGLLYNEKYAKLAIDLFSYNFFTRGFAFGPGSFAHLAPTAVKLASPEYVKGLNSISGELKIKANEVLPLHLFPENFSESLANAGGTLVTLLPDNLLEIAKGSNYVLANHRQYSIRFDEEIPNKAIFKELTGFSNMSPENVNIFLNQFYRNNLDNRSLVPTFNLGEISVSNNRGRNVAENGWLLDMDEAIDAGLVNEEGALIPGFLHLTSALGEVYVENRGGSEDGSFILMKVEPLGMANEFINYEFGNPFLENNYKSQQVAEVKDSVPTTKEYQDNDYDHDYYEREYDNLDLEGATSVPLRASEVGSGIGTEDAISRVENKGFKEDIQEDINRCKPPF